MCMLCEEEALYSAYLEQRAAEAAKTGNARARPAAFAADPAPAPAASSDTAVTDQTSESS